MAILLAISHVAPRFDVQYFGDYASIEPLVMCGKCIPNVCQCTNGDKYSSSWCTTKGLEAKEISSDILYS